MKHEFADPYDEDLEDAYSKFCTDEYSDDYIYEEEDGMITLTNKGFLEIMHKASESDDFDAYMDKALNGYSPYDLCFKKNEEVIL